MMVKNTEWMHPFGCVGGVHLGCPKAGAGKETDEWHIHAKRHVETEPYLETNRYLEANETAYVNYCQ